MGIATIISLWPVERIERRPQFVSVEEGYTNGIFVIPAAPKGGFTRLDVCDQYQSEYVLLGQHSTKIFKGEEVAADIARSTSRFKMGQDGSMGIYVAERPNMTDAEILASEAYRQARHEQDILMNNIVSDAREQFAHKQPLQKYHKMAAEYLEIKGEPWQERTTFTAASKNCPFCNTLVAESVVFCNACNNVIDQEGFERVKAQVAGKSKPAKAADPEPVPAAPVAALRPAKQPAGAGA